MGFDHQNQGIAEILSAFGQGSAMGDCAWDFFHPAYERAIGFRLDDGVIPLPHEDHQTHVTGKRQAKTPILTAKTLIFTRPESYM